ncbi:hypothetical protein HQ590_06785 [bacterium]|nr:hypothetical protein [bacterium]
MTTPTVVVPDTLDLVDRALLGINGLIGTCDPELEYEPYFLSFFHSQPQYMAHWSSMNSGVFPKYFEALALLRGMTGSDLLQDHEDGLVQAVLRNIAEDGLIYDRQSPQRPWNVGVWYGKDAPDEDFTSLAGDGRLVCAMDWYGQLTGDDSWQARMQRTCRRMADLAILKDDYAYYPNQNTGNDCSWSKQRGWTNTNEPGGPHEGQEGSMAFYQALPIRGWVRAYKYSGDERFLDLSRRITRFVMKPKFWGARNEEHPEFGRSRAHWYGHFHGTLAAFRGVLEYALLAEDYRALEFVRDGYEWARQHFSPRLGCDLTTEGCAFGDLTALAIQLSDAGVGDFWDDADAVVRNALVEAQYTDLDELRALGERAVEKYKHWGNATPLPNQETTDRVAERNLGAIACVTHAAHRRGNFQMACCTANANQGFYYAWEATVRHESGRATVNLLLNRFTPWLDVLSHLPYEGKVVIRNKTARRISVRIPPWAPRPGVSCRVNDQPVDADWLGRYLQFNGLQGGEEIVIRFPLPTEKTEITFWTICTNVAGFEGRRPVRIEAEFRGSTCIATRPVSEDYTAPWPGTPIYQRERYRADQAPLRSVTRPIIDQPIRWY